MLAPWKKTYDKHRQHIRKKGHQFASKGPYRQSYDFSSNHVQMWEIIYRPSRRLIPKNWCLQIVMLEKTLESPLDCKEIKPVNSKGNQSWIFIGRTDAEAQTPILWPPDAKSLLIGKELMPGTIEGRRRAWQRMRWLVGIIDSMNMSFSKLGNTEGQGSLACCSQWGCSQTLLRNWTTVYSLFLRFSVFLWHQLLFLIFLILFI